MSNGFMGCGSANAEFEFPGSKEEHKGTIRISGNWTSSSSFVELRCRADDVESPFSIYLNDDNGDAVEFAVAILDAVGEQDMALELQRKSAKLAEKQEIRQSAEAVLHAKAEAAKAAFLRATVKEREEYDATLTAAERAYSETTGGEGIIYGRSVEVRTANTGNDPF